VILAVVLMTAGFVLVVAEVFFPSLGMLGLCAAGCIVGADVIAYREGGLVLLWIFIGVQVVAVPTLLKAAFWALPKLPFGRGMILSAPLPESSTAVERSEHLVGEFGVAETDLRPSGTARFGDERRSVVAESGAIDRGTRLVVVAVEGYRVVVRPKS
jgi:membrane-bound serine protease (ClpP class)